MTGFPAPRLTATIERPVAKGALGRVTIEGEPREPGIQGGEVGRTNAPPRCSKCHAIGHISRNRKCPARSG